MSLYTTFGFTCPYCHKKLIRGHEFMEESRAHCFEADCSYCKRPIAIRAALVPQVEVKPVPNIHYKGLMHA